MKRIQLTDRTKTLMGVGYSVSAVKGETMYQADFNRAFMNWRKMTEDIFANTSSGLKLVQSIQSDLPVAFDIEPLAKANEELDAAINNLVTKVIAVNTVLYQLEDDQNEYYKGQ